MRRRWAALLLILWTVPFTITSVGVGMSDGKVLSLAALGHELAAPDPAALLRIAAWFVLLFPLLLIWWISRPRRTTEIA